MATDLQKKAVKELVEDGGNKGDALVRAGYKKNTAKTPKKVTESKGFQEISEPIIEQAKKERQEIMKSLPKVRGKAKYRDLMDGLDKTTKIIQLLTGGETERSKIVFMPMELMKKYGINPSTEADSD